MSFPAEIKRKLFHHLSLLYLLLYVLTPSAVAIYVLLLALLVEGSVEFIRLRRPELNAYFLSKFGGIHRTSEIMKLSGIFWTLLGCWATMVIFTNKMIVIAAIGFLVFGDTAAALAGKKWGTHKWANSEKSIEGSAAFAVVSILWTLPGIHWTAAILSSVATAWLETRRLPGNDNFWLPVLGGLLASIFNLFLGGRAGGLLHHASTGFYAIYAIVLAGCLFAVASLFPASRE